MWGWVVPCVEAGLASLSPDTVADWGCGLATSCRHRHPATLAPLLQTLTSHLLTGTTTSFREAARLYVLQVRFVFHFVLLFVSTLFLLPLAKWVASSCYMGVRGPAPYVLRPLPHLLGQDWQEADPQLAGDCRLALAGLVTTMQQVADPGVVSGVPGDSPPQQLHGAVQRPAEAQAGQHGHGGAE